jgi:hypothetical protein
MIRRLLADDQETCRTLADVIARPHKGAAKGIGSRAATCAEVRVVMG